MLEIENLTKTFGTQTVISDISMTLVSGKIYGLVGRNGSGKTMLMKMILGFVSPSSGSIKIEGKVLGKDISMPDRIGAIIENPGFLPEYSGFKNLKFLAMIHHKISNEEIRNARALEERAEDDEQHDVGVAHVGRGADNAASGVEQLLHDVAQCAVCVCAMAKLPVEGVD